MTLRRKPEVQRETRQVVRSLGRPRVGERGSGPAQLDTANKATGAQIFLTPHVHLYAPNVTNARLGVDTAQRPVIPMRVEREGRPDASIIVGVKLIEPAAAPK